MNSLAISPVSPSTCAFELSIIKSPLLFFGRVLKKGMNILLIVYFITLISYQLLPFLNINWTSWIDLGGFLLPYVGQIKEVLRNFPSIVEDIPSVIPYFSYPVVNTLTCSSSLDAIVDVPGISFCTFVSSKFTIWLSEYIPVTIKSQNLVRNI